MVHEQLGEGDIPEDHGKKIVEIVSNAAGEDRNRFQLSLVEKLFLGLSFFARIVKHDDDPQHFSLSVPQGRPAFGYKPLCALPGDEYLLPYPVTERLVRFNNGPNQIGTLFT